MAYQEDPDKLPIELTEGKRADADNEFYQRLVKERLAETDQTLKILSEMEKERRRKVPEPYFVKVLLPIVRAWIRNDPKLEPGYWFNISNGPNNEVDIVGPNGEILFVLPPAMLAHRVNEKPPEGRIVTPDHLVKQQVEMINNGDFRGVMGIERGLLETFSPQEAYAEKALYYRRYVDIYKRYNLPMEELLGPDWKSILSDIKVAPSGGNKEQTNDNGPDNAFEDLQF